MSDRYDTAVRGLIGAAILACAAAWVIPSDTVSANARARWLRIANSDAAFPHVALHTFAIDRIIVGNDQRPFTAAALSLAPRTATSVRGWAIAPGQGRTADRFVYRIDRGPWLDAAYHLPRPDVATALGMPGASDAGWRVDIAAGVLRPGSHTITLATVRANELPRALPAPLVLTVGDPRRSRP